MNIDSLEIIVPEHKIIESELNKQGRTIHWLAVNAGYCYEHTRLFLRGKRTLPKKSTLKMKELLNIAD